MVMRYLILLMLSIGMLGGCSGPTRRINPSTASIQELIAQPDGRWQIKIRIQNFSTVSMHYSTLKANLKIGGVDVGDISLSPEVTIAPESAEIVETTLKAPVQLPSGDFDYQLKGAVDTSEPKEHFSFDRKSRLSPVPGLSNTYR